MLGSIKHQQVLNSFRVIARDLKINYHIADYEFERIDLSVCKNHVENLNRLEKAVKNNNGFITKEILKASLK